MEAFTIIIPVYNEEKILKDSIIKLLKYLKHIKAAKYEVIVVDNGSTDTTKDLGEILDGIKFISIPKKGVGLAFKEGVENASYDNIISLDADLSIDLDFIIRAIYLLEDNTIVIGSKQVGTQNRTMFRKFLSSGFIFLTKKLLKLNYSDFSIGAKAYKKDFVKKHIDKIDRHTAYITRLIYYAKKENLKIAEISVNCTDTRKSKFNLSYEVLYRFYNLIKLWILG